MKDNHSRAAFFYQGVKTKLENLVWLEELLQSATA